MTCVRGASALQNLLQESKADIPLRVFVVWEPVIWSDLTPPLTSVLSRVFDRRAAQIWDKGRLVSAEMLRAMRAAPGADGGGQLDDDTIVWDCVAIYPPGARWEESLPAPAFIDCPVVEVIEEVARRLSSSAAARGR